MNSSTMKCLNTAMNVACIGTCQLAPLPLFPGEERTQQHPPQRQLQVPPQALHSVCNIGDVVVSNNICNEESLHLVSIKDGCDFWRLGECHGTKLFETENYYWRLYVGLEVKHEFVFYKIASPALSCQILTSGSYISHIRLMISHILLKQDFKSWFRCL